MSRAAAKPPRRSVRRGGRLRRLTLRLGRLLRGCLLRRLLAVDRHQHFLLPPRGLPRLLARLCRAQRLHQNNLDWRPPGLRPAGGGPERSESLESPKLASKKFLPDGLAA